MSSLNLYLFPYVYICVSIFGILQKTGFCTRPFTPQWVPKLYDVWLFAIVESSLLIPVITYR